MYMVAQTVSDVVQMNNIATICSTKGKDISALRKLSVLYLHTAENLQYVLL